jgi:hypothetical protein
VQSRIQQTEETDEWFYWHPSAISIIKKQAHLIKNWFKQRPELLWMLEINNTSIAEQQTQELIKKTSSKYFR